MHRMTYELRIVMRCVRTIAEHFHICHNWIANMNTVVTQSDDEDDDDDSPRRKFRKLSRSCRIVNKRNN